MDVGGAKRLWTLGRALTPHWVYHYTFHVNYVTLTCSFFKVDAQEKKKPKTGRAKRRQQYNSRFVNVVIIPGRRRGPNSNAA